MPLSFSSLERKKQANADAQSDISPDFDSIVAELSAIKGVTSFPKEQEQELRKLFRECPHPIVYDGFEPSGRLTLATGIMRVINAKRLMNAGCHVRFFVGDVFAFLNNKFGGDLSKIQLVSQYLLQVWEALGLETQENFEIYLASSEIARYADVYWSKVLEISSYFTVERIQNCAKIMGRNVDEPVCNANRVMYPLMQCADGFLLQADIYQLGADQDENHRLTEEFLEKSSEADKRRPLNLSHPILPGLKQDQYKMSSTDPESAIYVDDTPAEVNVKIKKAYCPPGCTENNPILAYMLHLIFPLNPEGILLERSEKNGGNLEMHTFLELCEAYKEEKVHPADLKICASKYINKMLEPVRQHFATGELKKLWVQVKKLQISTNPDGGKQAVVSIPSIPDTEKRDWKISDMTSEQKFAVSRIVGQECTLEEELRTIFQKKLHPVCYDGFEPSGRMHIAQGVLRSVNVNRLTSAGAVFRFWVGDWFAFLNNKMGGDLEKIRTVGQYMIEIWKSAGMDMSNVQFLWASDQIVANGASYWLRVMDIARRTTIARTIKCCTIMGRKEKEGMLAAQILYPLMQCADVFFLQADICQLGLDQRKINMLARDYCDLIKQKFKPIILSHGMLMGLKEGQEKMSKSDPESAIFMEDSREDVERKVRNAFCPQQIEKNPILDYMKHIIFPKLCSDKEIVISGKPYATYAEVENAFLLGSIEAEALKSALSEYLNEILEPVRQHFTNPKAKELLDKVRSFRVTR